MSYLVPIFFKKNGTQVEFLQVVGLYKEEMFYRFNIIAAYVVFTVLKHKFIKLGKLIWQISLMIVCL